MTSSNTALNFTQCPGDKFPRFVSIDGIRADISKTLPPVPCVQINNTSLTWYPANSYIDIVIKRSADGPSRTLRSNFRGSPKPLLTLYTEAMNFWASSMYRVRLRDRFDSFLFDNPVIVKDASALDKLVTNWFSSAIRLEHGDEAHRRIFSLHDLLKIYIGKDMPEGDNREYLVDSVIANTEYTRERNEFETFTLFKAHQTTIVEKFEDHLKRHPLPTEA